MYGQLIIMIVYLPILSLEGVEGKLFKPMAWTVILVLIGSLFLSLTLIPGLSQFAAQARWRRAHEAPLVAWVRRGYQPLLEFALGSPRMGAGRSGGDPARRAG